MTDELQPEAVIAQVQEILSEWDTVSTTRDGGMWVIAGVYRGKSHAGYRIDAISLAEDLKRIAYGEDQLPGSQTYEPPADAPTPSPSPEPAPPPEPDAPTVNEDPALLRAALRSAVTSHADSLLRVSIDDYERVIQLTEIIVGPFSTPEAIQDAMNELKGHKDYVERARELVAIRDAKLAEITALPDDALPSYDVFAGWPAATSGDASAGAPVDDATSGDGGM